MKYLLLLMLVGCSFGPAPMKCEDCVPICNPLPVAGCVPVQTYERGWMVYVTCECGRAKP
jgi:hypothetical protein